MCAFGFTFECSSDLNVLEPFVLIVNINIPVKDNQRTSFTAVISHMTVHDVSELARHSDGSLRETPPFLS